MFTVLLGVGIVIPVLPAYLSYFDASGVVAGFLIASFGITQFLFSPLGGKWSDRYGRKSLIIWGMVLNAISHLLFAIGDHLALLFISRLIGGIGLGFTIPSITAYVVDVTNRDDRIKGMGWIGAAISLGIAIGPGIGGFLASYSMRLPYYSSTLLSVLATLFSLIMLSETRVKSIKPVLISNQRSTITSFRENIHKQIQSGIFVLLLLSFIFTFGLMSFETVFPLFADSYYGYTTREIALIFTAGAIMGVIVQFLILSRLTKRFGEIKLIYCTLLFASISLVLMLLSESFIYILLLSIIFFTSQSLLRPILNASLSKRATDDEQGYVAGLGNTYMSVGNIFGPITAGILYDVSHLFPYLFGASMLMIGIIVFFIFGQREKLYSSRNLSSSEHIG